MAEELSARCARPVSTTVGEAAQEEISSPTERKEEPKMILIGRKAPDFTAPGYHQGKFINVKLSEYARQVGPALLLSWGLYFRLSYRALGGRREISRVSETRSGSPFRKCRQHVCSQDVERPGTLQDGSRRRTLPDAVGRGRQGRHRLRRL